MVGMHNATCVHLLEVAYYIWTALSVQDDVEQPGSEAYNVLINMHQVYGWAVNAKVRWGSANLGPQLRTHTQAMLTCLHV
jgi:hypothetical protein